MLVVSSGSDVAAASNVTPTKLVPNPELTAMLSALITSATPNTKMNAQASMDCTTNPVVLACARPVGAGKGRGSGSGKSTGTQSLAAS